MQRLVYLHLMNYWYEMGYFCNLVFLFFLLVFFFFLIIKENLFPFSANPLYAQAIALWKTTWWENIWTWNKERILISLPWFYYSTSWSQISLTIIISPLWTVSKNNDNGSPWVFYSIIPIISPFRLFNHQSFRKSVP